MKKLLLIALLLPFCLSGMAQKSYFEKALKRGRSVGRPYLLENSSNKWLDVEKVREYAADKGYLLGVMHFNAYNRFGEMENTLVSAEFVPRNELYAYVYEALSGNQSADFRQLTSTGSGYYITENNRFLRSDNILWSGSVSNGMLNGKGSGLAILNDHDFVWLNGSFENGFPVGDVSYRRLSSIRDCLPAPKEMTQFALRVGKMSDGMASFYINGKYGFSSGDGRTIIPPKYLKVGSGFYNGVAYVTEDKIEMKIDKSGKYVGISERADMTYQQLLDLKKTYPNFIKDLEKNAVRYCKKNDCSFDDMVKIEKDFPGINSQVGQLKLEKHRRDFQKVQSIQQKAIAAANAHRIDQSGEDVVKDFINIYGNRYKFDPDGNLAVARELNDYYTVCDALNITPKSSYFKYNGEVPHWDQSGDSHLSTLTAARNICSKGVNSNFKEFYAYAKPTVESKYGKTSSIVSSDRSQYLSAKKSYDEEQRRRELARQAKREREERLLKAFNPANIGSYIKDEGRWSEGRFIDSDDDFTDSREIEFIDLYDSRNTFDETIYHTYKRGSVNYYYFHTGMFGSRQYSTYQDALIGVFLYHYGKNWDNNRE